MSSQASPDPGPSDQKGVPPVRRAPAVVAAPRGVPSAAWPPEPRSVWLNERGSGGG